jgi:DNA replicative helicase MCM subunit Mcm2 (Cdc46/Mcm family)
MAKVAAIQEAIELIDAILADEYIDNAEGQLGINFLDTTEASEARKVVEYANELAQKDWQRLWRIFEGQNWNEYIMLQDRNKDLERDLWAEWFDGTDLRGWWD